MVCFWGAWGPLRWVWGVAPHGEARIKATSTATATTWGRPAGAASSQCPSMVGAEMGLSKEGSRELDTVALQAAEVEKQEGE